MKNDRLNIRISTELLNKLRELAESENRPLSNYVETVLLKHVEKTA